VGQQVPSTPAANDVEDGVERISRKECTRGRPVPAWAGRYGSRQLHSTSERSVGYALLIMLGRVPSHRPNSPFRTVPVWNSRKFPSLLPTLLPLRF
jgi:hypothetical protein